MSEWILINEIPSLDLSQISHSCCALMRDLAEIQFMDLIIKIHSLTGVYLNMISYIYLQFARPTNKRPPEQLILDSRRQEEQRQQVEELTKYNKLCDLKNDWERWTDRKIQINTVKRRVKGMLQAHQHSIEDRRER